MTSAASASTGRSRRRDIRRPSHTPGSGTWYHGVEGRLRPEVGDGELLRATFPPGSVTGAPKVQSLIVISELEPTGREVYTGAVGFVSPLSGLELNVAIRTLELADGHLWLGVGGGIVADSDPEAEARGGARQGSSCGGGRRHERGGRVSARPSPPRCRRHSSSARDRIRSSESSRRCASPAVRWRCSNAHLARLTDSARTLYGVEPELAPSQVRAAAPTGNARLRATFRPGSESAIDHGPIGADPVYERIAPFLLPGGLGPHKWMDRRLLDAITARAGEGSLPAGPGRGRLGARVHAHECADRGKRAPDLAAHRRPLPGRIRSDTAPIRARSRSISTGSSRRTRWY